MVKKPKKKGTSNRRQIYVPVELNARMTQHRDVNWSGVACEAFELELGGIAARKETKTMQDVIDRLRASQQEGESQMYKQGFSDGQGWAKHTAEALELERLENYRAVTGTDWDRSFYLELSGSWSHSDYLALAILGQDSVEADRGELDEFWESLDVRGSDLRNEEYLYGFAEGALDIWDSVKSQL